MILAWLCFFDGFVALAVMAAGIVGAHCGLAAPASAFKSSLSACSMPLSA